MLAQPEAALLLRQLAKSEFDSREWVASICALSRLGGRSVAMAPRSAQELDRAARAAGGGVGVAKLSLAAEMARKALAHESTPIMNAPDEVVANAVRLAARK